MTTNIPSISVILPVYNGMGYLQLSVESVLNQLTGGFNFEFLICDDCSTDDSYAYLKTLDDSKVKLYKNEHNKGLFPTLNFLLKETTAPLVHLWAQDDVMLPNCLESTLRFHKDFPNVNFSFSRLQHINEHGVLLEKPDTFQNRTISVQDHAISSILYGSIAGNIANVCLVKEAVERLGYFDASMKYVGDFKMWCLLSKDKPVGMNGSILVNVRRHSGQLSRNINASYSKLIENYEVYKCFLGTLHEDFKKPAKRALKWKIYPMYFNQFLYILRNGNFKLASRYLKGLKRYDIIPFLFIRWLTVKVLKVTKLERHFFDYIFFDEIVTVKERHQKSNIDQSIQH
ncbi:glycosyltransferase family 2 protein [Subsaxibacter sp. CAU 1640]|uniref:glycosyltransferase family 2 protein n=1 Tax=Subsaxibacter sp. CAU 1640 TaxID=2933271 RepID=UPI00200642D3|nr:glycosyltransferase family 2 protein [Subsaxibacter sp. CAU 1640]MCK7590225.1 glycosyltransferase family 2 protein [Subsaxibacter sp. CAU 1640]